MSLLRRSVTSAASYLLSGTAATLVSVAGLVWLARILGPATVGAFVLASTTVKLSAAAADFGMQLAFLHRTGGSDGVSEIVLRVTCGLKLLFSLIWAAVVSVAVLLLAAPEMQGVYFLILGGVFLELQTGTVEVLLIRQIRTHRLGAVQAAGAVLSTAVAVLTALSGWGVHALAAGVLTAGVLKFLLLVCVRPVWKFRPGWDTPLARVMTRFGGRAFGSALLKEALDRLDDLWTGAVFGEVLLGLYSKAFLLATSARRLLISPLIRVVAGIYARLRDDREALSAHFGVINQLLVRANGWLAGVLWLVVPELVSGLLGPAWLPAVTPFRWMLLYALLDPVKDLLASLVTLSGAPQRVIRVRLVQLLILGAGLAGAGTRFGLTGVAVAVTLTVAAGIVLLYREARRFVDFSLVRIFAVPLGALVSGMGTVLLYGEQVGSGVPPLLRAVIFSAVYAAVLLGFEHRRIRQGLVVLRRDAARSGGADGEL